MDAGVADNRPTPESSTLRLFTSAIQRGPCLLAAKMPGLFPIGKQDFTA
jgi:hypothetical protein